MAIIWGYIHPVMCTWSCVPVLPIYSLLLMLSSLGDACMYLQCSSAHMLEGIMVGMKLLGDFIIEVASFMRFWF